MSVKYTKGYWLSGEGAPADTDGLYWVALRGPAILCWPTAITIDAMRRSAVIVGESGEPTVWAIDAPERAGESNYDVLIGYKTPEEQEAAVETFLRAPLKEARAAYLLAVQKEVVIWGRRGPNKAALAQLGGRK
jgi:hypothetical protein